MPDFDIDFCIEGRDRVIDYVASRYGRDRVSQIITFGTMAARAVVRDVGRVLGHSYGYVDRIAKLASEQGCLRYGPAEGGAIVGYFCMLRDPSGNICEFSHGQPINPRTLRR